MNHNHRDSHHSTVADDNYVANIVTASSSHIMFVNQAICECAEQISTMESAASEYSQAYDLLCAQSDSTSTEKIIVLLGDNWFAETSHKNAKQITQRRLVCVRKCIAELKQDLQRLQDQQHGLHKILSTCDDTPHESSADVPCSTDDDPSQSNNASTTQNTVSKEEFDQLMKHLDELEAQEDEEDRELLDSDDDSAPPVNDIKENTGTLKDDQSITSRLPDCRNNSKRHRVSFGTVDVKQLGESICDTDQVHFIDREHIFDTVHSSHDENIDRTKPASSILRNRDEKSPIDANPILNEQQPMEKKVVSMPKTMFSGDVIERNIDAANDTLHNSKNKQSMSLFKLRLQQHHEHLINP